MTDTELPQHLRAKRDRLAPASAIRNVWHYTCEGGQSIEETMVLLGRPEYWTALGKQIQALDHIEVVSDDTNFFCEFIVLRSDATSGVVLRPLRGVTLDDTGPRDTVIRDKTGMRAEYKGPHRKWCVLRGDKLLAEKLPTEHAAFVWINGHTDQKAAS